MVREQDNGGWSESRYCKLVREQDTAGWSESRIRLVREQDTAGQRAGAAVLRRYMVHSKPRKQQALAGNALHDNHRSLPVLIPK